MFSRRHFMKLGGVSVASFEAAERLFSQQQQQPPSTLQTMTGAVKPLTPEDFEARQEKAKQLMARYKIDALFLIGSADMQYFLNHTSWVSERTTAVILNTKRKPIWVVPAFELEMWKERIPADHDIRAWQEEESPYRLVAGVMKDLGAAGGRLGIGPQVRAFQIEGLRKDAAGIDLVDGAAVSEGCRSIKTEKELAYLELANKITKLAYREAFKSLREGMTTQELSGAISAAHKQLGVSGSGGPQFGPNSALPHGSNVVRTLQNGYTVMVDGGCKVEGYSSDVTRTVVFGSATEKHRRVFDIVRKAQMAVLQAARPGATCESVDAAARKVIEDGGYGPGYRYFLHRVGHGIGLDGHEYPYLVKGNQLSLQPGMTFSNEPGVYIQGEFGLRLEDCFVVTDEGGKTLGGLEAVSLENQFGE